MEAVTADLLLPLAGVGGEAWTLCSSGRAGFGGAVSSLALALIGVKKRGSAIGFLACVMYSRGGSGLATELPGSSLKGMETSELSYFLPLG